MFSYRCGMWSRDDDIDWRLQKMVGYFQYYNRRMKSILTELTEGGVQPYKKEGGVP